MPIKWKISRTLDKGMQSWITHIFVVCISKGWVWMSTTKKWWYQGGQRTTGPLKLCHTILILLLSSCDLAISLSHLTFKPGAHEIAEQIQGWEDDPELELSKRGCFRSYKNSQFLEIGFVNLQRNSLFLLFRGRNLAWSKTAVVVDARLGTCLKPESLCAPRWLFLVF